MDQMDLTGDVLRIERSSIHDGDGFRTVVFLKGCPLRCKWCSTPESWDRRVQVGHLRARCKGCGSCVSACPEGAITLGSDGIPRLDSGRCTGCLACVDTCHYAAYKIYGGRMSVHQVLGEIEKDTLLYFHSGGGVTLSGGEVMAQTDFAAAILEECLFRGINTAIETSLFGDYSQVEKILPYLNTLFVDIKLFDRQAHQTYTGVSNEKILENIRLADASPYPVEIRVRTPLIPSVNDSEENLRQTAEFCGQLKKIREIELLPYHRLGTETYHGMGLSYPLPEIHSPSQERMRELAVLMHKFSNGVPVRTGEFTVR